MVETPWNKNQREKKREKFENWSIFRNAFAEISSLRAALCARKSTQDICFRKVKPSTLNFQNGWCHLFLMKSFFGLYEIENIKKIP